MGKGWISQSSTDGGKTHTPRGAAVTGQSITDFSFISEKHGFASSVSQLQICSLLEFA